MQCSAWPSRRARSTAFSLSTGNDPGSPRHTGHTFVFGSSPKMLAQPQNNFVLVASSQCTSSPQTISHPSSVSVIVPGGCAPARCTRAPSPPGSLAVARSTFARCARSSSLPLLLPHLLAQHVLLDLPGGGARERIDRSLLPRPLLLRQTGVGHRRFHLGE